MNFSIGYAQTGPTNGSYTAVVMDSGSIQLTTATDLTKTFTADLSAYENFLVSNDKVADLESIFAKQYITVDVNASNKELSINLLMNNITSTWTHVQWNSYLETN